MRDHLGSGRLTRSIFLAVLGAALTGVAVAPATQASENGATGWGEDQYAQLGVSDSLPYYYSTYGNVFEPAPLGSLSGVLMISPGYSHTLDVQADGTARAWGLNNNGQLGIGTHTGPEFCSLTNEEPCSRRPVAVNGLDGVKSVAAGAFHSLALLSNGTVMAWGANNYGQLGLGTVTGPHDSPALVPGLSGVKAIAAGEWDSFAVLEDGTVKGWGSDEFGALGVGSTELEQCTESIKRCLTKPTTVSGLSGVRSLAAGGSHGLALLEDGTVRAWGYNATGEIGDGSQQIRETPVAVKGLTGVSAVAAGRANSTALLENATVMDWGTNWDGELGVGNDTGPERCTEHTQQPCSTVPVAVSGLSGVTQIAAGAEHTLALLEDGSVMAWGYDEYGMLGTGESGPERCGENAPRCSTSPVAVSLLTGVSAIAAGGNSSFARIGLGAERPVVSKVSPEAGAAQAEETVTIGGANFAGATAVFFGSVRASHFTVDSAGSITATSPRLPRQTVDVSVLTPEGYSAASVPDRYSYQAVPSVFMSSPNSGPTTGGTRVTLTGNEFTEASTVRFGAVNATFTVNSPTSITAVSPAEPVSNVEVRVTNKAGTSVNNGHFNYTPVVEAISPNKGPIGGHTSVTVTGTGFRPGENLTVFKFGSTKALNVSCSSSTTCNVLSPPHAAGTVNVRATVNKESSPTGRADRFTYS